VSDRSISRLAAALALVVSVGACAAQRAQGPLELSLGMTPAQTARAVERYDFCRRVDPDARDDASREIFPQCGRPGVVYGDAWVVAHYRGGVVVRLQRFERWPDRDRASARWNQLLERRAQSGAATTSARDRVFARQGIPEGTAAWVAFERPGQLVGLYLLSSTDPTAPAILEEIVPLD